MKLFVFAFIAAASTASMNAFAQNSSSTKLSASSTSIVNEWSAEGRYSTLSNSTQPTFGASLLYKLDARDQAGFGVLSGTNLGSGGTASLMGIYRHRFSERRTSLLGELTLADNYYASNSSAKSISGISAGTGIGLLRHLTPSISLGGIGGFEWTNTYISNNYAYNDSNVHIYGRISVFGALEF